MVKNPPAVQKVQETQVQSLSQEDPLEKGIATHSSILAWGIPVLRRTPEEGNSYPFKYAGLENSMDRGAW